jgi:hypothetical protein
MASRHGRYPKLFIWRLQLLSWRSRSRTERRQARSQKPRRGCCASPRCRLGSQKSRLSIWHFVIEHRSFRPVQARGQRPACPGWVKTSKAQNEHMFSGLPPKADLRSKPGAGRSVTHVGWHSDRPECLLYGGNRAWQSAWQTGLAARRGRSAWQLGLATDA